MKRLVPILILMAAAFAIGSTVAARRAAARNAAEQAAQSAAWLAEKAKLESALKRAQSRSRELPMPVAAPATLNSYAPQTASLVQPDELLQQLAALTPGSGAENHRVMRQVLVLLEELAQVGPPALPAIRAFLASGQDVPYANPQGKGPREVAAVADSLVPYSLRFALLDVVRQIGGPEAEVILSESLQRTVNGLELAYVTQLLEELAPGRYQNVALAAARALLAAGGLPESDRHHLFSLLRRFNDATYVGAAQSQLVRADGTVDRGALRYLQQTLGDQSIAIAARLFADPRLQDPDQREPLARLGLAFVGANDQAAELFHQAVLDPALKPDHRRELVEDLNQDGIVDRKTPTPQDLQLIANRFALTESYLQQDYVRNDKLLFAAFKEADKDLRKMLEKAAAAAAKAQLNP